MTACQAVGEDNDGYPKGISTVADAFQDPEFHRRELTLLASRNSTGRELTRILRLMEEGKVETRAWITHRAAYQDLVE